MIHISDMSWTKHIKHPSEIFKKGQKVEAVVLRIDKEKERLSLGYKQLTRDPWDDEIPARYRVGDSVSGKVSKVADFGIFVEIEGGVEGLIHISEAGLDQNAKLEEKFKLQDEVDREDHQGGSGGAKDCAEPSGPPIGLRAAACGRVPCRAGGAGSESWPSREAKSEAWLR